MSLCKVLPMSVSFRLNRRGGKKGSNVEFKDWLFSLERVVAFLMPRKPRIGYPGAVYHVISRCNYRKESILNENTGEAFEHCLRKEEKT